MTRGAPVRPDRPHGTDHVAGAVTVLFVPGDRPERFGKAAQSGADLMIIDLEDAVAPTAKPQALAAVLRALAPNAANPVQALVRVNASGTRSFESEIEALLALAGQPGHALLGLMLPKADDPAVLRRLADDLAGRSATPLALVPLVESALGVVSAIDLARVPGVTRMGFGAIDFALDVDAANNAPVIGYARAQVVVASRAAGISKPLDSPSTQINDPLAVAESARSARADGFGGKLCIHPAQLEPVRSAFLPTPAEIAWARSVVDVGDAAVQVDGQMIDRPVSETAKRILQLADRVTR